MMTTPGVKDSGGKIPIDSDIWMRCTPGVPLLNYKKFRQHKICFFRGYVVHHTTKIASNVICFTPDVFNRESVSNSTTLIMMNYHNPTRNKRVALNISTVRSGLIKRK